MIADYTGVSIFETQKMPLDVYLFFMREAYIHELSQTKEGQKYLEDCWRIIQTKPDRQALRDKIGRNSG